MVDVFTPIIANENKMNKKILTSEHSQKLAILLLLIFIGFSLWLIFEYAEKERNRDLLSWQSRLSLLAELRAADISEQLTKQKTQLQSLATNPSLKLYLSQLAIKSASDSSALIGQQGHIKNLLRASAERFNLNRPLDRRNQINNNSSTAYGLAILDAKQQLAMSTRGFPKNTRALQATIDTVYSSAQGSLIDIYLNESQQPVYGFILPVFKIQDMQQSKPIGAVMLLLNPFNSLYGALENKQSVTHSDESLLVKTTGPSITYLSPLKNNQLFHQLADDNNHLAASYAHHNPGGFAEIKDYQGVTVLVTGRKIINTPWSLIQKISSSEALEESNTHQEFLLTTFTLLVLMLAAAFIAIWRHSTSIRLLLLSERLEAHTALLDAVTDKINEKIILVDKNDTIIFINPSFLKALNLEALDVKSKKLSSILGRDTASQLHNCKQDNRPTQTLTLAINSCTEIYHIMTNQMTSGEYQGATLYVLHDISSIKKEQEKRELLGQGIIATLVKATDLHDPHCINHSQRTRQVATDLAIELQLRPQQIESLAMASMLANIGKLFVPKEILTKMTPLSDDESKELKRHIDYAVEILADLPFSGPVVDIIAQKNERLDGSGYPKGLSGNEIMLESKILAVANAFVAMASSRAYREGRAVKQVIDILISQSETQYDRHVVAALFHIAENKADWKTWQTIKED